MRATGLGYRTLTPGANIVVSYADTGSKILNFKVNLTNSTVLQSHSQLHVIADPLAGVGISVDWSPGMTHGFSPAGQPGLYNVTSTATYNGIPGRGLISVQLSTGHNSLTNPLIVAEGFDPGIYTNPENPAGLYTLGDFTKSVVNSNSTLLRNLLEGSADGTIPATYDIIFIDFKNGTDDIRRNALVVEDVIRWVNDNKTGTNQNVVLGLSMGGLCERYALKKMENAGETHQTRLFISHGAPEQGAVVPLGLQFADNHAHTLYVRSGIGVFLYNIFRLVVRPFWSLPGTSGVATLTSLVNTPAAEQMLVYHSSGFTVDNSVHLAWQQELNALGYPAQGGIRNIAISNGSECGQTQTLRQSGQVFLIDGKLSTPLWGSVVGTVALPIAAVLTLQPALLFGVIPGRNDFIAHIQANAAADYPANHAYNGRIDYRKTVLGIIPITITMTNRSIDAPSGTIPYETFAGDFFSLPPDRLIKDFHLANLHATFDLAPFCFVTTPSALDIGHGSATLTESDYSLPYSEGSPPPAPKNTPFANFITAFTPLSTTNVNNNEGHITFETRNGNWLVNELTPQNLPNIADCSTLCQNFTISGDLYDCNEVKTYSVPTFSNVTYQWSYSNNLQPVGVLNQPSAQFQPLSGTNGQQGYVSVDMTINNGNCGTETVTKNISIGVEPLVVNSTVDRTPQQSNYQYLTATATQLPGTATSDYTWWLTDANRQVQYQIGSGLQLTNYPIAPCSTIYYQCQAVTPCGTAIYNGYAYNTTCGGDGFAATNQSVVIYPNPASTTMTVTNNNIPATTDVSGNPNGNVPQSYQVKVYNDKGKILRSAQNEHGAPDVTVSTADMPDGNYFLHIIQGSSVIEKQVMVRH